METNEVTTAFVGSTAATNRTTASTAKATPVISRRVRSSSRRGSSVACGRAPLACFALFSAGEAALPFDFVAEDAFGFAVLDAEKRSQRLLTCGVITTPAKTQLSSRLDQIYRDLNELIAQFHPEVMAVEELFFNTNITTGIAVAHGRGIILLSGYQAGLQIYEYTPLQVKQAVVGYGRADKKQVMDMVRRILSLQAVPKPDDAADAVAIALCHARSATSLIHQQERFDPCSTI